MSLLKLPMMSRFITLCLLTLTLFTVVLGFLLSDFVEKNHFDRAVKISSAFLHDQVLNHFDPSDFSEKNSSQEIAAFERKIESVSFGPDVSRVKVWSSERRILWSDSHDLIGKRYENNEHLNHAFAGEVTVSECEGEHEGEKVESEVGIMGLYVPISFDKATGVDVVFEVYTSMSNLNDDIYGQKRLLWIANLLGSFLLFATLTGVVYKGGKTIIKQGGQLEHSNSKYLSLLRFAHDAIVVIDRSGAIALFNQSAERLFGISQEVAREEGMAGLFPKRSRADLKLIINRLLEGGEDDTGLLVKAVFGTMDQGPFEADVSLSATGAGDERVVTLIVKDPSERAQSIDKVTD